jgi:mannose-6-phosphate isomerase-like protein (cupin superfamily)
LDQIIIIATFLKINHMEGYKINIEKATTENANFRKVLYTSSHLQLVLMSLQPGEQIGSEVHHNVDQFFRIEEGNGIFMIDAKEYTIQQGDVVIVPAGARHNIINVDDASALKMYTIYGPPNHKDGTVHLTRAKAEKSKEVFDGVTTESAQDIFVD